MKEFIYPFNKVFKGLYRTIVPGNGEPAVAVQNNIEPTEAGWREHQLVIDLNSAYAWAGPGTSYEDVWEDLSGDVWTDYDGDNFTDY